MVGVAERIVQKRVMREGRGEGSKWERVKRKGVGVKRKVVRE